ncbi:MAG: hypothetical protein KGD63_09700 [Candidatus Lokiarchaeota archaeon]|nr:hypothetical protein [Candidatus Lokiarchaeota archaeon]
MDNQRILKEAQIIASKYSFWMVSGDINHLYGYVYKTDEIKYELEIKFSSNFPHSPPELIFHEKIRNLLGDIQLNTLFNWDENQKVVNIIDELKMKIQERLVSPQEIPDTKEQNDYITPDMDMYSSDFETDQYVTPTLTDNDFYFDNEDKIEKNNPNIEMAEENNNLPKNIITSPEELFVDSDSDSLKINTELGLIQQEYAFDHQGDEIADIVIYMTITLTKTFLININFSNYPNKPTIILPNEIKSIFGDINQTLTALRNWEKKNPLHIIDIIHELEKKLSSVKKIETEVNTITQEYQFEKVYGSLSKIQVKLLTYGFKEYFLKMDLETFPKLPIIELTQELRDLIRKPLNELESIKNWVEKESESISILREVSWLIDKHSRINFEIDLLREHYKNINYDILSNTIYVDMKGKMKSEDLTFEFKIELPKDYPMMMPKIIVVNEFDIESHEKIKNDLNASFKDFYNDWTPNHYLVDLFNMISKKIFEVSVVSCVICHKIECPECNVRIAGAEGDSCHIECPYCERSYHKHCWTQTIKSFGKCGFCLKTPPPSFY